VPLIGAVALATVGSVIAVAAPSAQASVPFAIESLNGAGNNVNHPTWGQANLPYARVGAAHYADGVAAPMTGPNARFVSNRVINDASQNVFSERRLSNWGWTWGQFLDHTFGHRIETGSTATPFNIGLSTSDPLESFHSNVNVIGVDRSPATAGTGTSTTNPRQQTNQIPSYLAANTVYGADNARLDWLRTGSLDGNPTNNAATLMLPGGYLPTKAARGNPAAAPAMDTAGRLLATPNNAMVAGDVRANENMALTATHTLFAREHNRIVSLLPSTLSDEDKFQIARRVVIAEEQYVTYQEWLPSMGVALPRYAGYNPNVNPTLSNEFATVGYRAHTQIHGDGLEIETNTSRYSQADLNAFEAGGMDVTVDGADVSIDVPLGVEFFNSDMFHRLQVGPVLASLSEIQYNNDEEIDNQLRSTLFDVPSTSDSTCLNGPTMPNCFSVINDLGAIDIQRNRDHGLGTYNQIRQAYGLPAKTSFTAITGESTEAFPSDPLLTPGNEINDPNSLDVTKLSDIDGKTLDPASPEAATAATHAVRRTTLAARLRAIYGNVNNVDGFVGVFAEPHVPGTEMGETQLAIWTRQFQALRDGDRFYFGNDQGLSFIRNSFGIDFKHTLAQIIQMNTDVTAADLNPTGNVFLAEEVDFPGAACTASYTISNVSGNTFTGSLSITNNSTALNGWSARFNLYNGQSLQSVSGGVFSQSGGGTFGRDVTVNNLSTNGNVPAGATISGIKFTASFDGTLNAKPTTILLNGRRCGFA